MGKPYYLSKKSNKKTLYPYYLINNTAISQYTNLNNKVIRLRGQDITLLLR